MKTDDLINYGIPQSIVDIWKQEEGKELFPIQEQAIKEGKVLEGESLLIVAPTSSGKTFVGEIACCRKALEGMTAILLVPFKAIAEEKFWNFSQKYNEYGIRVVISTGDHREYDADIKLGNFGVSIFTYEKLSALLVTNPEILENCGLIVVDEIQMMMDKTRGGGLELLLTKFIQIRQDIQFIGLSAVLDRLNDFDKWLNCKVITSYKRPVELRDGIYLPSGTLHYREWNSKVKGKERFPSCTHTDLESILDHLVGFLVGNGEQVLIFRNTVDSTVETAKRITKELLNIAPATNTLMELNTLEDTGAKGDLQDTLRKSVAFHNSDLTVEERLLIEKGFREGEIKVVCSTSTLSMGVNLPAKTVIIPDLTKWEFDERIRRTMQIPITTAEYRNMAGRAGRVAYEDEFGRSILIAISQRDYDSYYQKYIIGPTESFISRFGDTPIDLQVLDLASSGLCKSEEEIMEFLSSTYAGFKKWSSDLIKRQISKMISESIRKCCQYNLLEKDSSGTILSTALGKTCASKGVSVDTFDFFRKWLEEQESLELLDILFTVSLVEESGKVRFTMSTNEYRSGIYIQRLDELLDRIGASKSSHDFLQNWNFMHLDYENTKRLKMALTIFEWINAHKTREIEKSYRVGAGAIRNVAANMTWLIDTLAAIAAHIRPDLSGELEILADRVLYGVKEEGLFLARLNVQGLGRESIHRLLEAGYTTEDQIMDTNISDFQGIISHTQALRLRESIEKRVRNSLERRKREHIRRIDQCKGNSILIKNLYEFEGKQLEMVVDDLFKPPFWSLPFERVTEQKEGEPDHLMYDHDGNIFVVQVTAKKEEGQIKMKKAVEVIGQSAKFSPKGYIVIGRPEFHELAIKNARDHAKGGTNFKLITIFVLCEIYVRFIEGKLSPQSVEHIFLEEKGIIDTKTIEKYSIVK